MARKVSKRDNRHLATLVTGKGASCAFCLREVDDEITYGKLYAIGDIQCHYFCCLLSCCLIQKGHDEEGLFGFMYTDIVAEIERCKKHKCSYCSRNGANLGCSVGACRKQFHLPCGRDKNAISLYYGSYKSFCQQHAPKQKIPDHIMMRAKLRMKLDRSKIRSVNELKNKSVTAVHVKEDVEPEEMVCVICYEPVDGFPAIHTFWPPCCAKDAWFHRTCLQRMALSAGMHYLKCPLCNDKENFYEAVVSQGYYVPDRDAAWELEQNAFAEIYERPVSCCADECACPMGRGHDAENGKWDIKLCLLCGSAGAHAQCLVDQSKVEKQSVDQTESKTEDASSLQSQADELPLDQPKPINKELFFHQLQLKTKDDVISVDQSQTTDEKCLDQSNLKYVCHSCLPAAPEDMDALASSIEAIIQEEQAVSVSNARRPVMPSRMSLRRTKGRRIFNAPSSSRPNHLRKIENETAVSENVRSSRLELNLKSPSKAPQSEQAAIRAGLLNAETKLLSPVKLLEQSFKEKVVCTGVRDAVLDDSVIETLRRKFRKPRPLCEKKRIVNDILDGVFDNLMKDASKKQEQIREWCSPKKSCDVKDEEMITEIGDPSINLKEKHEKEYHFKIPKTPVKENAYNKIEDTTSITITDIEHTNKNDEGKQKDNDDSENANSVSKTVNCDTKLNNEIEIEKEVPTKNSDETTIKSITKSDNPDIGNIKTVLHIPLDEICNAIIDKHFSKPNLKSRQPLKRRVSKKSKRKSLKKRKSKKNCGKTNNNSINKNILNVSAIDTAKESAFEEMHVEHSVLRRLLTEKDLCAQLLSELTSKNNNEDETPTDKDINKKPLEAEKIETQDVFENPINLPETPKSKTIDIQQDSSLEISEKDQSINIDVIKLDDTPNNAAYKKLQIKLPENTKTCFKISPLDKETLEKSDVGMDLESFKKEYLNEVDREFKCNFKHKHVKNATDGSKLRTALDFAIDAANKREDDRISNENRKRKLSESSVRLVYDSNIAKKRKTSESDLKLSYNVNGDAQDQNCDVKQSNDTEVEKRKTNKGKRKKTKDKRRSKKNKRRLGDKKNIEVTIDSCEKRSSKNKKIKKKIKTKFAIQNNGIHVKIKWKKKQLSLNIESKKQARKEKKQNSSKLKQYVLQFPEGSSKEVLVKPEKEVCLLKRKYVKQEKNPDKLKQTSIQSFFKLKSET